eukprot:gene36722-43793_t
MLDEVKKGWPSHVSASLGDTFLYEKPASLEEAVGAVSPGTRFIAGGTNLLDLMKLQVETPDKLVDISRLDLAKIEDTEAGGLLIGALVPN